jgi:hypothetical protein
VPANGSPTCTVGRFAASAAAPNSAEASTDAPPIPSRPVRCPMSTATSPGCSARASCSRVEGSTPTQSALTSGLPS